MKFVVEPEYRNNPALPFIKRMLQNHDVSNLHEFKIRKATGHRGSPGIHGNCKCPSAFARKGSVHSKFRISCSIRGTDDDFPRKERIRRHAGTPRAEWMYDSVDKLLVFVAAHEMYHFLARSGQIKGDYKSERNADTMGRAMVTLYTKGVA